MNLMMTLAYYPERVSRSQHKEEEQRRSSLESKESEVPRFHRTKYQSKNRYKENPRYLENVPFEYT